MSKLFEDFLDDIQSDELTSKSDDLTAHNRELFEDGVALHFSLDDDKVKREDSKVFRQIAARIERIMERHRHIIDYSLPTLERTDEYGDYNNVKQTFVVFSVKHNMRTVPEVMMFIYSIHKALFEWRRTWIVVGNTNPWPGEVILRKANYFKFMIENPAGWKKYKEAGDDEDYRSSINEVASLAYRFLTGTRPAEYITDVLAGHDNMFDMTMKQVMKSGGRLVKLTSQSQAALDSGLINIPEKKDTSYFLANLSITNYMSDNITNVHEVRHQFAVYDKMRQYFNGTSTKQAVIRKIVNKDDVWLIGMIWCGCAYAFNDHYPEAVVMVIKSLIFMGGGGYKKHIRNFYDNLQQALGPLPESVHDDISADLLSTKVGKNKMTLGDYFEQWTRTGIKPI